MKLHLQFWSAWAPCDSQYKNAVTQTFEQIDALKRLFEKYHEDLLFVTTANGVYHTEMHFFWENTPYRGLV